MENQCEIIGTLPHCFRIFLTYSHGNHHPNALENWPKKVSKKYQRITLMLFHCYFAAICEWFFFDRDKEWEEGGVAVCNSGELWHGNKSWGSTPSRPMQ